MDAGPHKESTQKRLSGVWGKMLIWTKLAGEIDVAFMLDTDILIRGNIDTIFKQMTHAESKGVYRGVGEFSLTEPRPPETIKLMSSPSKLRRAF